MAIYAGPGRRRDRGYRGLRRGGAEQPPAAGAPQFGDRGAAQGGVRPRNPPALQPRRAGGDPRDAHQLGQRPGAHRRLRCGGQRRRQLPHPLSGERRRLPEGQAPGGWKHPHLRWTGHHLPSRARVLPMPLPHASPAGDGAQLCGGGGAGGADGAYRQYPGHRGGQGDIGYWPAPGGPAAAGGCAQHGAPHGEDAAGPGVPPSVASTPPSPSSSTTRRSVAWPPTPSPSRAVSRAPLRTGP